ncbi:Tyrosine-protein kinase Fps85D [Strongyloides ratti]|uniref:Tyrosine-protein kinase Fps85D n=1 Tax=Strongyloides ratti TaxID=34506 RepID=A0A090LD37_STRRB|nr:Tyrosine-protein kinase Fps85D [Strongyloides ratti]CEF65435.1 Tyrosine-protein kinase Fps85D [Strongyloides ratti]
MDKESKIKENMKSKKESQFKNQQILESNNNKMNPLINETNLIDFSLQTEKKNYINLKDKETKKEKKKSSEKMNNDSKIKNIEKEAILPLDNTQSLMLRKTIPVSIAKTPVSSLEVLISDNSKVYKKESFKKKLDMEKCMKTSEDIQKCVTNQIKKNDCLTKVIYNTEKLHQNIKNKHFGINKNILNMTNNDKNNNYIPFYTFTNKCRIYADMISPKTLIKIDNYNNYGKKDLNNEPYYVGVMSSKTADKIKIEEDEFFLRKVEFKCESIFFISIFYNNRLRHHLILKTAKENLFYIKKYCFQTVQELIRFHLEQRVPIKNDILLHSWVTTFSWHRQHNEIQLIKKIASSSFSQIFIGNLEEGSFGKILQVVIKIFTCSKEKLSLKQKNQFISDANIIINLKSKYLIQLIGVCIQKEPFVAILEYASKGSLSKLLTRNEVTEQQKHNYCLHVAYALKYLHDNLIMHRNIAAKNVLIGGNNIAKLSNLGFVFQSSSKDKKKENLLRWTSPETIKNGTYTFESESWSYGIFISEVYNDGEKPFLRIHDWKNLVSIITNNKAKDNLIIRKLPDDLNNVLIACLNLSPNARPDFDEIISMIEVKKMTIHKGIINWTKKLYNQFFVSLSKNQLFNNKALYKKRIYESISNSKIESNSELSVKSN